MKKIIQLVLICSLALFSCTEDIGLPFRTFVIPEGEHYSTYAIESMQSTSLNFKVLFDSTAIYQTIDPIQQFSTNKLLGFADCNSHHHENSARFGWQWVKNELQIIAYNYVNSQRQEEFVGVVDIGVISNYRIEITDDHYIFTLDDYPQVIMERGNNCNVGVYYMLFPYFGGQEVAPHDITIKIRTLY